MNAAALFVQPTSSPTNSSSRNAKQYTYSSTIITELTNEFSNYKFTVYRCAAKINSLQKKLYTSSIPFKLVEAVLGKHKISAADSNLMIPPFQLLQDIYFVSERLGYIKANKEYQLESATNTLANFLWNTFDPHRRHSISLLEFKVTFMIFCKLSRNEEMIAGFYRLICDRKSKCVSKFYFEYLLNIFAKILTCIGEGDAYGTQNISKIIEQSYARCHNPNGLTEQQFINLWTITQTRFLIYANLFVLVKRMECTEKLVHNNTCTSCGIEKIVGIRFKCHSCKNLSLCLKCFASGFKNNKHQGGHRVYEILNEDVPPKKVSHYFAKLCNVFFNARSSEESDEQTGFCNKNEDNLANETELLPIEASGTAATKHNVSTGSILHSPKIHNSSENIFDNVEPSLADLTKTASNASNRLQSIIDRVLIQNFKIEQYLGFVPTATPEQISAFLRSHQKFLTEIIREMRDTISHSNGLSLPTSSTPNHSGSLNRALLLNNSNLSVLGNNLTHSINGAEINRSYLDANKSDFSLKDVSFWFNQKGVTNYTTKSSLDVLPDGRKNKIEIPLSSFIAVDARETEMTNFRRLLHKVKEIVEDSYSDNTELAAATQNLENVLDDIIKCEETRRCSLDTRAIQIE